MPETRITIFLSHVREDESLAVLVKTLLEGIFLDAEVFVSGRDLAGGQIWFEELRNKLERATAIVALVSRFSRTSSWVYFESGAGFIRKRTIPLVVDGVTLDNLRPPLSWLQARQFDSPGLTALIKDIAAGANVRQPVRFPGLDETIQEAATFLALRKGTPAPNVKEDYDSRGMLAQIIEKLADKPKDQKLQSRVNLLEKRAHEIVFRDVQRYRAAFELPSIEDMRSMDIDDLFKLAEAVGVSIPVGVHPSLLIARISVPAEAAPVWEKMNVEKRLQAIENALAQYERQTARGKEG